MKKLCDPFPLSWCRNVDFLPILSMQSKLNEKQILYYFEGSVSTSKSRDTKPLTTDLGITISPSTTNANKLNVFYGDIIPNVDDVLTLREIWDEIKIYNPEAPDVVIHKKGIIHEIPRNIMYEKVVDGADYLFQSQSATGNHYRLLRKKTNLPIVNTYQLAKSGLLEHHDMKPSDPCFRRIKSILKTDWIKPSNNVGWHELQHIIFKLERGLRGKIKEGTSGINWWEDTAQPMYFGGTIDHTALNVRICMLDDLHKLIGI